MPTIALLSWPLVSVALFAMLGREKGLIWSVLIGYLFLPENVEFDLPALPPYAKYTAVPFGLAISAFLFRDKSGVQAVEHGRFRLILFGMLGIFCLSVFFTILDNGRPLINGPRVRSGLSLRDATNMAVIPLILIVPYFLACRWLRTDEHHRALLVALVIAGFIYSLLALIEIRLSPQINKWVYGFFPHDWRQHLRGGYRPVVFLRHGLWLAFFMMSVILASAAMFRREETSTRLLYALAAAWVFAVLLLSSNLGASMLAILFVPLVLFIPKVTQARVIAGIAIIFLAYPMVRQANLLPIDGFLSAVSNISAERAASLQFRLENEDAMLDRAAEKPLFGWGGWGRARIIDDRGRDTTVTDGLWIIILSERGWIGYLSFFGLVALPMILLPRTARRKRMTVATTALGLIMAANLIYIIPNSTTGPIAWLIAGSLAGFVRWRDETVPGPEPSQTPRAHRYTRFAPGKGSATARSRAS